MKFTCRLNIFILSLLLPMHLVYASSASQALTHLLNPLQSLQANFIQKIMDNRGQILQETRGQMILQRPGKFRWEVMQPTKQLLIADGQRIWFYDIALQQVVIQKQQQMSANSPAALLSGATNNLTKLFDVNFLMDGQSFYLKPKDKNSLFSSISLIFRKNQLIEMRLKDKLEQQTVINFSQLKLNPSISVQAFKFVLPKDKNIEIVES